MPARITIFAARKIITMDSAKPFATHVAVREGRILGVGSLAELQRWGAHDLDLRFGDKVLMPGLVEGHSHIREGMVWEHTYLGSYPRQDPHGSLREGVRTVEEIIGRLARANQSSSAPPEQPLIGWGFDPLFVDRALTAADLDQVSDVRPVVVFHASFHLVIVNSVVLQRSGHLEAVHDRGSNEALGLPRGVLPAQIASVVLGEALGEAGTFAASTVSEEALWQFARSANRAGVTTATDLYNTLPEAIVRRYQATTSHPDFPVRIVPAFACEAAGPEGVDYLRELVARNTDKLRFGIAKLVADGSIQGFTARLKWPGYFTNRSNGLWYVEPDDLRLLLERYHRAGFQVHIHTNGDMASELALDAIEDVLCQSPRLDHRHTLQHCQMADGAQFRRMKALGVCVNLFANHLFYWGDAHYAITIGPDRAERMNACATALKTGIPLAIHSDAPITPLAPFVTAWCAVNRTTQSGRVLGEAERISVPDALQAITLGAAYTLKMDHEIGSIEIGKYADFCVLDDDPLTSGPEALRDVRVWGTVLSGRPFPGPKP